MATIVHLIAKEVFRMARKHTSDLSHTAMSQKSVLRQKSPCVAQAGFTCLVILSDGGHSRPLLQSVVKTSLDA